MIKKIIIFLGLIAAGLGGLFYFYSQVYRSHGGSDQPVMFTIEEKRGVEDIAKDLEDAGLISWRWYFNYYVWSKGIENQLYPGEYRLRGSMTIPEIAYALTKLEKDDSIRLTFPEGWDSRKMAERLTANGLDGKGFLEVVSDPVSLGSGYGFLKDENIDNLEGYLFPDTYSFFKDDDAIAIVSRMIEDFEDRLTPKLRSDIKDQGKTLKEVIAMASIIEREVKSSSDRKVVSGIFWKRIKNGQPLQSCATIGYALGENKKQYSFEDTRTPSPYNTYINKGLPPGPISNPGIDSIEAAIYPQDSPYNYFLSDPDSERTIFSKTIDEHNANKVKYGL